MQVKANESELFLVVDGGGTKTDCQLLQRAGDGFTMLGQGQSTASNPGAIGVEPAAAAIRLAIERARHGASLDPTAVVSQAALAIAGTVNISWRSKLERALATLSIAREVRVFPDVLPPVLAGSLVGPAAAIIAGTGSAAIARNSEGEYCVTGGWGYLLGDEGSGFGIGRDALRVALEELESETTHSPFVARVLEHFEVQSTVELKQAIYSAEHAKTQIAGLTPVVLKLAADNEPIATKLLDSAVKSLEGIARRALARLQLTGAEIPLAIAGGMFRPESPLRDRIRQKLLETGHFSKVEFVDSPLVAAQLLLADGVFRQPIRFV